MVKQLVWVAAVASTLAACAGTHVSKGAIGAKPDTKGQELSGFCMNGDGDLVVADEGGKCLRVISPDDTLKACWKLDFAPQAVAWSGADKTVLAAGSGKIAALDGQGKAVIQASLPQPVATSVAAGEGDVFVTLRAKTGYTVYRLDARLENPKAIISGLRGCCGQMDVTASGDTVYVAANCDFEVSMYDRDGKKKGAITKPKGAKYFDGCCEPKNVFVGSDGSLYVAESARCAVNRFSKDGKHLGEVGIIKDIGGCVRVTVAASKDGSRVYMLDTEKNTVRVLQSQN
jgi:sugar lactone lactonase YvrE